MSSIRTRPGRPKPWEARWPNPNAGQLKPDGKREPESKSQSFHRKVEAQRFLATVEADHLRGTYVDPSAGKITFKNFSDQWLEAQTFDARTREGTASRLRAHLVPAFGSVEIRGIRPSTVQAWLGGVSRTHAPSTVRLLLATLSAVLGAAVEDGLIASNPCRARSVQAPAAPLRRVQPWSVDQVQRAVASMPDRYKAAAVVAAGCGLRQGEIFGLRVCDVDFLRHRLEVRQQTKHVKGQGTLITPPKRGRTRTVPLPETVAGALAEHLRVHPAVNGLIFTNTAGGPINRGSFNDRVWKPAVKAAGLQETRENGMHALRHHYASVLLAGGVSIRALAEYLGHSYPGFTLRVYTHLMLADSDKARRVVDAAFSDNAGVGTNETLGPQERRA